MTSATYSGRDIFCKFEKKSLFRMVDAERIDPFLFATTCRSSSGSATPSVKSTRSRGFSAERPSARRSFSKVLITEIIGSSIFHAYSKMVHIDVPGCLLTKLPKGSTLRIISGCIVERYHWKMISSK